MYAILWLVLLIAFLLVEATTVTMVSIWFVAGSLVAMIISFLGGQIWLQVVAFLEVSAILLVCLRPWAKKYLAS